MTTLARLTCWLTSHRATPLAVGWVSDLECSRCSAVLALREAVG